MNSVLVMGKGKCYRCKMTDHVSRSCPVRTREIINDYRMKLGTKKDFPLLVSRFSEFAETLRPDAESRKKAGQTIHSIYGTLQVDPKLSVDRLVVAGSAGKKTALPGSDYDLVVFLNGKEPPFTTTLQDMKSTLSSKLSIPIETIKTTRYSLQFKVNGLEYDLLPAVNNMVDNTKKMSQLNRTLDYFKNKYNYDNKKGEFNRAFGSSVTEFAVSFVAQRHENMLNVIRLAKRWNSVVDLGDTYISGRSTMIELVAIGCNRKNNKKRRVLTGFTRFLLGMANFKTLNIAFFTYYQNYAVPVDIMSQRPLILDPSNPMNNFAHGFRGDERLMEIFEDAARRTLEKIASFELMPAQNCDIEALIDPGQ